MKKMGIPKNIKSFIEAISGEYEIEEKALVSLWKKVNKNKKRTKKAKQMEYQENDTLVELYKEKKETDEYVPEKDDLDYSELVDAGVVKDMKGTFEADEVKMMASVTAQVHVADGTGYYAGWKSNAQKMLRRGKEKEMLVSIVKIADMGGVFLSNIINRLCKVMVCEDIGPAAPWYAIECANFLELYEKVKKMSPEKDEEFRSRLLLLAKKMCRAKKSRVCDNIPCYYRICKEEELKTEEEFDGVLERFKECVEKKKLEKALFEVMKLERIGGQMARGESLDLKENQKPLLQRKRKNIYKVWKYILDRSRRELWEYNSALLKIFNMGGEENFLQLYNAVANLILYKKGLLPDYDEEEVDDVEWNWEELKNADVWIDPVSYDKHVAQVSKLNRGIWWFFRYGAKLANKREEIADLDHRAYNRVALYCLENKL